MTFLIDIGSTRGKKIIKKKKIPLLLFHLYVPIKLSTAYNHKPVLQNEQ